MTITSLCFPTSSSTSIINLADCLPDCDVVTCLTDAIACTGCSVIPQFSLFESTLSNPTIIANLAGGGYISVEQLIQATTAELDAVPGIGPASIALIQAALAVYNLETLP